MKHLWHKIIAWYLRRCWGSFHCYPYGEQGRYVVLMNETQYHNYKNLPVPSASLDGVLLAAEDLYKLHTNPIGCEIDHLFKAVEKLVAAWDEWLD